MNSDLISRSELKEVLRKRQWYIDDIEEVEKIIDNAPTVKFSLMPADETKEDAYKRGYEKGKIAGILMANTRPQGEWLELIDEENLFVYLECSNCGDDSFCSKTNFCPNCGADMRKGGVE